MSTTNLPIARLMPGETVWSAVARTHLMLGGKSTRATMTMLFGREMRRLPCHLLPGRLREFVARCAHFGVRYNLDTLVREHTGLPYFIHFHTEAERARAVEDFLKPKGPVRVRALLDLQKMRGAPIRVRPSYCSECAKSDYKSLGFAYWRVAHQLPVVVVCPKHGSRLLEMKAGIENSTGRSWDLYLPPIKGQRVVPFHAPVQTDERLNADQLNEIALHAVIALRIAGPGHASWQAQTRAKLLSMGYRTHGGVDYTGLVMDIRSRFGDPMLEWLGLKMKHRLVRTGPLRRVLSTKKGRQLIQHFLAMSIFQAMAWSGPLSKPTNDFNNRSTCTNNARP